MHVSTTLACPRPARPRPTRASPSLDELGHLGNRTIGRFLTRRLGSSAGIPDEQEVERNHEHVLRREMLGQREVNYDEN